MTEIKVLQQVVQILQSLGLEPHVYEKSPDVPFDVALVSLGMDEKERSIVLQVIHAEQSVVQAAPQERQEGLLADSDCHLLSFIVAVC